MKRKNNNDKNKGYKKKNQAHVICYWTHPN